MQPDLRVRCQNTFTNGSTDGVGIDRGGSQATWHFICCKLSTSGCTVRGLVIFVWALSDCGLDCAWAHARLIKGRLGMGAVFQVANHLTERSRAEYSGIATCCEFQITRVDATCRITSCP